MKRVSRDEGRVTSGEKECREVEWRNLNHSFLATASLFFRILIGVMNGGPVSGECKHLDSGS